MFRIKICGITDVSGAATLAASGVEAVGLNFYPQSKRYVGDAAPEIAAALPPTIARVGVFVNATPQEIEAQRTACHLDFIQLHGDEPPALLADCGAPVIRAFRVRQGLAEIASYLEACPVRPAAVLLDAYDPQAFGGTGKTLFWPDLAGAAEELGGTPVLLAGGLTPENVGQAIAQARPHGVDTASGVEKNQPGRKDATRVRTFVQVARAAFAKIA